MASCVFGDRAHPPNEATLQAALQDSYPVWCGLRDSVLKALAPMNAEWGFSSPKTGWGLRLKSGKRAILYMAPCEGFFLASFALGGKAVQAAKEKGLPSWLLDAIEQAPRYAEGRGVRLKVTSAEEAAAVLQLAEVKYVH